jgi:chromosome segregation ATPase
MSGFTKADYKQQAQNLASELEDCREANNSFKAQNYKLESDLQELQASYERLALEFSSLRKQLKMISDWITAAAS